VVIAIRQLTTKLVLASAAIKQILLLLQVFLIKWNEEAEKVHGFVGEEGVCCCFVLIARH
jgi:hypothetical protein